MNRLLPCLLWMVVSVYGGPIYAGSLPGHTHPLESFDTNVAAGGDWLAGALLVASESWSSDEQLSAVLERAGCGIHHRFGRRFLYRVQCSSKFKIRTQIEIIAEAKGVVWVEPYWLENMEETPNDLTSNQWHHLNDGQTIDGLEGIVGADIGSTYAWDVTVGNGDPLIAIIDTGIYRGHEELQGRLFSNPNEICGNGVDEDENGYVDDCDGWDVGDDGRL